MHGILIFKNNHSQLKTQSLRFNSLFMEILLDSTHGKCRFPFTQS